MCFAKIFSQSVAYLFITCYFCIKLNQTFCLFLFWFQRTLGLIQSCNVFPHLLSTLSQYQSTQDDIFFPRPKEKGMFCLWRQVICWSFSFCPFWETLGPSSLSSSFLSPVSNSSPLPSKGNVFPFTWYCCFHLHCVTYICLSSGPHILPSSLQSSVYRKIVYNFPITRS